jgi:hypothetical protein
MRCSRSLLLDVWVRILYFAALVGGTLVLAFYEIRRVRGWWAIRESAGSCARGVDAAIHVRKNWTSRLCARTV